MTLVYPEEDYRVELRQDISPIELPADLSGLEVNDLLGLSPEHFIQNQALDHRSDLYSVGYLAYYLLTGQVNPYGAQTAVELAEKIKLQALPDPSLLNSEVPEWLSRIVQKLTAPDPSQRYQSIFSLIRQIESGIASEPIQEQTLAVNEPPATDPNIQVSSPITQKPDFNPYQPVQTDKSLKSTHGKVIKGLLAGLGVVLIAAMVGFVFFKGKSNSIKPENTNMDQKTEDNLQNTVNKKESIEMVLVSGGTFDMGDISGRGADNERPVHSVNVSSFLISKYEITQKEWKQVMGNNPSKFKDNDLPVEQLDWYSAIDFCDKLSVQDGLQPCYQNDNCDWNANGYRLPTEAEWEFAAKERGLSRFYYSGSDDPSEVAWFSDNAGGRTHRIGTKRSNILGIYDMSGNVCEWCWDWYSESYDGLHSKTNPRGADHGRFKVTRGGSYEFDIGHFNVSDRNFYRNPSSGISSIGIRLVRSTE